MEVAIDRKQTAFRLSTDLRDRQFSKNAKTIRTIEFAY